MKPKIDLRTHCALCGARFPLTRPLYANMSGTYHQTQLPCPCETRSPPKPPDPQPITQEQFMSPTQEELAKRIAAIAFDDLTDHYPGAKIDLDP